jgi:hypothetical protein
MAQNQEIHGKDERCPGDKPDPAVPSGARKKIELPIFSELYIFYWEYAYQAGTPTIGAVSKEQGMEGPGSERDRSKPAPLFPSGHPELSNKNSYLYPVTVPLIPVRYINQRVQETGRRDMPGDGVSSLSSIPRQVAMIHALVHGIPSMPGRIPCYVVAGA